jgi:nitrile hydratase accessory protein
MGVAEMSVAAETVKIPEMSGAVAYPRKNGEPVFDAPWQSRAFGLVVRLHAAGVYPWDDFKALLIDEVSKQPCKDDALDSTQYYLQWVNAFWRLLVSKGILSEQEMKVRAEEFQVGVRQEVY